MVAWVLNLDADLELALGPRLGSYTPTAAVRHAVVLHARSLLGTLTASGDLVVDPDRAGRTPA